MHLEKDTCKKFQKQEDIFFSFNLLIYFHTIYLLIYYLIVYVTDEKLYVHSTSPTHVGISIVVQSCMMKYN